MASALVCSAAFVGCTPEAAKKTEEAKKEVVEAAKATGEAAVETAKDAVEATKEAAGNAVEAAKGAAEATGEAAKGAVDALKEKAGDAKDAVLDTFQGSTDAFKGQLDEVSKSLSALPAGSPGASIVTDISAAFSQMSSALAGIKDADSATAALPAFGDITNKFGSIQETFNGLPAEAKAAVAKYFASTTQALKPTLDKLLELPGVKDVLKPAVDGLLAKLEGFKA